MSTSTNIDHDAATTHYVLLAVEATIRAYGLADERTKRALEAWAAVLAPASR